MRRSLRAVFALQLVAFDLVLRGRAAWSGHSTAYAASALASISLGIGLATLARRGWIRVVLGAVWALLLVVNARVFAAYHAFVDAQLIASAVHAWSDVRPSLVAALPSTAVAVTAVALLEVALLRAGQAPSLAVDARARGRARSFGLVAAATIYAVVGSSARVGTPELRLASAAALALAPLPREARAARDVTLARVAPPREPPSVLVVVTESVRATDYCAAPRRECAVAPQLNALLPERVAFPSMRAVASYTALALASILTGRSPMGPRDEQLATPTLFHFARAAGLFTAFYSAHLASVLEGREVRGALDDFASLETLLGGDVSDDDPRSVALGVDRALAARALPTLGRSAGASLVVLQFAATHAPYAVDPADAPFTPYDHEVSWRNVDGLRNAYRNAIRAQDAQIARCVRAFVEARRASPWIVVFTSDHGEAFGEHGAIHHGQNVYDEQIHVPAFIAHGNGGLDAAADAALRAGAARAATHLDLVPTLLDALGTLDAPAHAAHVARLTGRSLLRARPLLAALPLSNCTPLFPCPLDTWGMLSEDHKVLAQPWDSTWRCTRLTRDEELPAPPDDPACVELAARAHGVFPRLPNGRPLP